MVGTLLGFGWRIVGSWLAECCFMVGGLYIHTYPLRSSGLFRPMYRSMCWHVQLHAHASLVPYSCKETSHSASDSLIDVLTCLD